MPNRFARAFIKKVGDWLQHEDPPKRFYLCDFDRISYELKPADVILVEGRHRVSNIIRRVTSSPWTHAALYIGRLHDIENDQLRELVKTHSKYPPTQQLIIESLLGQGTVISPLNKYKQDHIRISRPIGLSHTDAQKVIAFAVHRLGSTYSLRHIFDLFRLLFPWGLWPRRWRSSLFQHNALQPTEDICSSMIAQAFASVHFPVLPIVTLEHEKLELIQRNPRLFTPSDFDYSPYFAIIKYPIFHLDRPSAYQKLPWRAGLMADDEGKLMPIFQTPTSEQKDQPS